MAIIAECMQTVPDFTSIDNILPPSIAQAFPVPSTAWGFLDNVDFELTIDGFSSPYYVAGALTPEASRLEPTIGQIWPR